MNRHKSITTGGVTSTYAYDGDGKRASKTVGQSTTGYVYDANRGLPVVLTDGALKYVWGLGLAYTVDSQDDVLIYHTDGLGSVRALTDESGDVVASYLTDEFGIEMATQGSGTQPFEYTGEQRDDESGLVYLRARMYDPSVGRFTSRDSLFGEPAYPSSLHRYTYAGNDPVNLVDPSGGSSSRAAGDNECVTTVGGLMGGYLVNLRCLGFEIDAQVQIPFASPLGRMIASGILPMSPPKSGSGQGDPSQLPRGNWLTASASRVKKALGLTDLQFRTAVHAIKEDIPGNPNVLFDIRNGDVYDPRSGEQIGNLFDALR